MVKKLKLSARDMDLLGKGIVIHPEDGRPGAVILDPANPGAEEPRWFPIDVDLGASEDDVSAATRRAVADWAMTDPAAARCLYLEAAEWIASGLPVPSEYAPLLGIALMEMAFGLGDPKSLFRVAGKKGQGRMPYTNSTRDGRILEKVDAFRESGVSSDEEASEIVAGDPALGLSPDRVLNIVRRQRKSKKEVLQTLPDYGTHYVLIRASEKNLKEKRSRFLASREVIKGNPSGNK